MGWRKVQAVVLPEDWRESFVEETQTNNSFYLDVVEEWLVKRKTTCLQVWEEGR